MATLMGSYTMPQPKSLMGSTGGAGGATIPGAPPTGYSPAYGGIPAVPNPVATAGQAIAGDISNLGSLYNLGTGTTNYMSSGLLGALQTAIPDYSTLSQTSSRNVASELGGNLPQDVVSNIIQNAAERGIMTGAPLSPNSQSALLRSLGLSSLDMTQMGEQNLTATMQRTPYAQPFDISRMFVTPDQMQQAAAAAALYRSAPIPSAAARAATGAAYGGYGGPAGGFNLPIAGVGGAEPDLFNAPSPWTTGYPEVVGDPSTFNLRPPETDPYAAWASWASGIPTGTGTAGGGTASYYDPTIGGYVDYNTGQISDTPGGAPWEGFSYQGVNTPAAEPNPYE